MFSTRIGAYGCCLSFCISVLSDGKTLPAVAVSCECGLQSFSALQKFVPVQSDVDSGFCALMFLCAAPGRRCRAEWDAVPLPAGALPPSPPRATAPLDGRNALRGRVYCFVQPADRLSCFLHRVGLGGVTPSAGPRSAVFLHIIV